MRRSIPFLALLLAGTASCGAPERASDSSDPRSRPVAEPAPAAAADSAGAERAAAGPGVSPTAAPGVAFNYRYAFALAPARVSELVERHAAMCEQLTPARCRITGLHYQVLAPEDIEARLELKLEPGGARQFGRGAVNAVLEADGMLTRTEISGTDIGSGIRQAGRDVDQLNAELRRIEARLAQRGLSEAERGRLEDEARQLRERIAATRDVREAQEETLATTPMVLEYGSGRLVPGYRPPQSLGEALARAGQDFVAGAKVLLVALIRSAPWLIFGLIVLALVLYVRRRWFPRGPKAGEAKTQT